MKGMPLLLTSLFISGSAWAGYGSQSTYVGPCDPCGSSCYIDDSSMYDSAYKREQLEKLDENLELYNQLLWEGENYENSILDNVAKWSSKRPSLLVGVLGGACSAKALVDYLTSQNAGFYKKASLGGVAALCAFVPSVLVSNAVLHRMISKPLSKFNPLRRWTDSKSHKGTQYVDQRLKDLKIKMKYICQDLSLADIDMKRQEWHLSKEQKEVLLDIARKIRKERSTPDCY